MVSSSPSFGVNITKYLSCHHLEKHVNVWNKKQQSSGSVLKHHQQNCSSILLSHSITHSGSDDWCILISNKHISYMSNVNKTLTWHEARITDCCTWILMSWFIKILVELSTVVWSPMYNIFQGTLVTAKTYIIWHMYIYICINLNCPFFCKSTKKCDAPGNYTPQT